MSQPTKIEWTVEVASQLGYEGGAHTWNPVRGCSRVSEGCRNCYAERMAARFSQSPPKISGYDEKGKFLGRFDSAAPSQPFYGFAIMTDSGPRWTGKVEVIEDKLDEPLRRRKPTVYFVNSMSDLFHEKLPESTIDQIFAIMSQSPQHLFLVLTKRAQRMREYLSNLEREDSIDEAGMEYGWCHANTRGRWPLPNLWPGVSVEDGPKRIEDLVETPATVRWVSYEPALGPLDLRDGYLPRRMALSEIPGSALNDGCSEGITKGVDWVVAGGESGPKARPSHPDWFRSVRDDCQAAKVPFFFKQWGNWAPALGGTWFTPIEGCSSFTVRAGGRDTFEWPDGYGAVRLRKKASGRLLDGREWLEVPKA